MSKEKGITLSPKHGVNPSIPTCFFCGESKNEIVLFGRLKNDQEAPRQVIMNYDPCDKCASFMEQGVTFIAVSPFPAMEGQAPIQGDHYPTGSMVVVKAEAPFCKEKGFEAGQTILCDPKVLAAIRGEDND